MLQLSICKECILIHLHHPFIFTHVYRFKWYASCCSQVKIQCTTVHTLYVFFVFFDNHIVNILCSWRRWRLHHRGAMPLNQAKCPCYTHNHHLTTSLTVFNTTTLLTLVSHLNRVQLCDIVWIGMLLLCCLWAWFPFLSTAHEKGPIALRGVKMAASELWKAKI